MKGKVPVEQQKELVRAVERPKSRIVHDGRGKVAGLECECSGEGSHSCFRSVKGCYIFQYSYPGEDREEYLIGTWFGKKSVEYSAESRMAALAGWNSLFKRKRTTAISLEGKMAESLKFLPAQGGHSCGFKNYIE
ncbi:VILLIN-5 [Salix purpurea]|uniref:VILLIN-5 n=1 Tax=Salix purpurea TaxID=77065 RepID=A0A9Q0PNS3_SALPP|nr:VILLIN-5 [Salix purpurea]